MRDFYRATVSRKSRLRLTSRLVGTLLLLCFGAPRLPALEDGSAREMITAGATPGTVGPLRFRRVFVPQDRLNDVRDPVLYFPVNAAEFEEMVAQANNQAVFRDQTGRIVSALYRAVLKDNDLVGLEGEWFIELPRQVEQAFILLGQVDIALGEAVWADTGGLTVPVLTDSQGRLGLLVNRSGKVHFRWSARPLVAGDTDASVKFSLTFPPAVQSELHLIMPEHWHVTVDKGLLLPTGMSLEELPGYRVVFHGGEPITLVLSKPEGEMKSTPSLVYREKVAYELTLHGLEATWQWDVDVLEETLDSLSVELPGRFQISEARLGDVPLSWDVVMTDDGSPHAVTLRFPQPLRGLGRTITVRGIQPISLDNSFLLPTLVPKNAFWLSRNATVVLRHPLRIYDLQLTGARLKEVVTLPAAPGDMALEIVADAPNSQIRISCDTAPAELHATTLIRWTWDRNRLTAQLIMRVRSSADVFHIPVLIAAGWNVEEVTSESVGILDDWVWTPAGASRAPGLLSLHLRKAIPPETGLLFRIGLSRELTAAPQALTLQDIFPLVPGKLFTEHRIYGVLRLAPSLSANYEVQAQPELPSAPPAALDSLRQWTSLPSSASVFELGWPLPSCRFRMIPRPRRFIAQISGVLQLEKERFKLKYEMFVHPDESDIDRVRLLWTAESEPSKWTWKWQEKDGPEVPIRAEPVPEGQQISTATIWDVFLPRPIRTPGIVTAECELPIEVNSVPLPVPVEATRFDCILHLASDPLNGKLSGVQWSARGMRVVAEDPSKPGGGAVLTTYRYEGGTTTGMHQLPELRVSPSEAYLPLPLWAMEGNVAYRLDGHGAVERWHVFTIFCPQGGEAVFTLPPEEGEPMETSATLDGEPIFWQRWERPSEKGFRVVLPPQTRECQLLIRERFAEPETLFSNRVFLRRLRPAFPVYSWRATAWTPPAFQALCTHEFQQWGFRASQWGSRLFGPLWRPSDQPLFIPDRLNRILFDPSLPPPNLPLMRAEQFLEAFGENAQALVAGTIFGEAKLAGASNQVSLQSAQGQSSQGAAGDVQAEGAQKSFSPITWRELLSDTVVEKVYDSPPRVRSIVFLVDREAFDELNINPGTRWQPSAIFAEQDQKRTSAELGAEVLKSAGLVLAITPRSVVLTSVLEIARNRREIVWQRPPIYKLAAEGDWVRSIEISRSREGEERYCRVRVWNDLPADLILKAQPFAAESGLTFAQQGWNALSLSAEEMAHSQAIPVLVVPADLVSGSRWLVMFYFFVLAVMFRMSRRLLFVLGVTAAIFAAFVPEVLAPAVSGIFLGSAIAILFSLTQSVRELPSQSLSAVISTPPETPSPKASVHGGYPGSTESARVLGSLGRIVIVGVALVATLEGRQPFPVATSFASMPMHEAQNSPGPLPAKSLDKVQSESPEFNAARLILTAMGEVAATRDRLSETGTPAGSAVPPYRIFIPVDDQGRPVGQEVYVPEEFYKQLQRRTRPLLQTPPGWQFSGAFYRGTFSSSDTEDRWQINDFHVAFEVFLSEAPATLEFPLGSESLSPRVEEILVDGRPAAASWNNGRVQITMTETGRHRLRIPLSLRPVTQGTVTEVSGVIPSVVNARLELAASPEFLRVELPSAMGRVERDPESGTWSAELGPTNQLVLRWPAGQPPFGESTSESECLYLLEIRPEGLRWSVRWKIRAFNSLPSRLRLTCDPDLTLVSLTASTPVDVRPAASASEQQGFDLTFTPPLPADQLVAAEFLQPMSKPSGGIRLPAVKLSDVTLARQDLIVMAPPGVKIMPNHSSEWQPGDFAEIQGRWQLPALETGVIFSNSRKTGFWGAWIVPEFNPPQSDDTLQLTVGEGTCHVIWQARFSQEQTLPGSLRVILPPEFDLQRVALYSGAVEYPVRFSQKADQLLVLLEELPSGEARLLVEGTFPIVPEQEWLCPQFSLRDATTRSLTVLVFAEPGTKVDIGRAVGFEPLAPPSTATLPGDEDTQVAAFTTRQPANAELSLRAQVHPGAWPGYVTLRLYPRETRWLAEISYDVDLGETTLQELSVEVTMSLAKPLSITPSAVLRLTQSSSPNLSPANGADGASYLTGILVFSEPQKGKIRVTVTGEVSSDNSQVILPLIKSSQINVEWVRIFLPRNVAWPPGLALLWGLRPLSPDQVSEAGLIEKNWVCFEGPRLDSWPPVRISSQPPGKMTNVECILALNSQRELFGWMEADLTHVLEGEIITAPLPGTQLVAAWLDGTPVPAFVRPGGRWQIPVDNGPPHRTLECLFYHRFDEATDPLAISFPQFEQLTPVERFFLWVESPTNCRVSVPALSATTHREYELTRAKWLAEELLGLAAQQGAEKTAQELRLARRFLWLRDRAWHAISLSPPGVGLNSAEVRLQNLELETSDLLQTLTGVEALSLSPGEIIAERIMGGSRSPSMQRVALMGEEVPAIVNVDTLLPPISWPDVVAGLIAVAGGLTFLAAILRWWEAIAIWLMRFAHAALALLGIGWWLYLRPSFLGWFLILSAFFLLIRSRWQWVPQEEAEVPLIVHQPSPPESASR